jgi:signal transduction histidine kinase
MNWRNTLLYLAKIVGLAIIYHLAARLGLQMAYVQQNTSPVWPPSGIALAALLLAGIGYWPGITLGVVAGSLLTGAPLGMALGFGAANTLEAVIAAVLLKKWIRFDPGINRIRDVTGLVAASACGTAVSAVIGVTTLILSGSVPSSAFFSLGIVWFIGNLLGCLVITPFLLTWARLLSTKSFRHWQRSRILESAIFLVCLIFVSLYVFASPSGAGALHQALIYVIFPFAIWAALRMGTVGAASTVFAVSGIAIWGTIHELGPFAGMPINESLILLQTFTGVVALISLTLAAASAERRRAVGALRKQVDELAALNEASKQFLEIIDKQALYQSICQSAVESFDLCAAWIDLTATKDSRAQPAAAYPQELLSGEPLPALYAAIPDLQGQLRAAERTGQPLRIASDVTIQHGSIRALTTLPLMYGKELVGHLTVAGQDAQIFSQEQMLLLDSFANLAAAAIQNSWLFDQVRLGNEQLHALSHRLIEVQEAERIHLSRELHDESSQALAGLMVHLGLLDRDAESPELVRSHAAELKRITTEVLANLHAQAVKLRPASLDHLGLVTALQQYILEFNRQHHLDVQFETVGLDASRLPSDLEIALFRIVQESLSNVVLHARASRVDVLLNRRTGFLVLTVEDDGVGFDPNQPVRPNRLGLFGMRERVEMLGGKLMVESAPGKGTMISVEVPYGDARPDRG